VRVDRDSALDLRAIALDLSRKERRTVTLGDVIRRLIEIARREWAQ
jgi:hypothetical protein